LLNILAEDNSSLGDEEEENDSWKSDRTSSLSDGMPTEDIDRMVADALEFN